MSDPIKDALTPIIFNEPDSLPRKRVLSNQIKLLLLLNDEEVDLGEVDNFQKNKQFNVLKKWKPFGSKKEVVLIDDRGWDITFTGGKVDWKLGYLIYCQEKSLIGLDDSNFGVTFEDIKSLYNKPIFSIKDRTVHYNGDIEEYIYQNLTITDFSEETESDLGQTVIRCAAHASTRKLNSDLGEGKNEIDNLIFNNITEMKLKGKI